MSGVILIIGHSVLIGRNLMHDENSCSITRITIVITYFCTINLKVFRLDW